MRTDVTSVPEEETSVLYEETSRRTVKNESWGAMRKRGAVLERDTVLVREGVLNEESTSCCYGTGRYAKDIWLVLRWKGLICQRQLACRGELACTVLKGTGMLERAGVPVRAGECCVEGYGHIGKSCCASGSCGLLY